MQRNAGKGRLGEQNATLGTARSCAQDGDWDLRMGGRIVAVLDERIADAADDGQEVVAAGGAKEDARLRGAVLDAEGGVDIAEISGRVNQGIDDTAGRIEKFQKKYGKK